jgi:hypothetical protein
MSSKVPNERNSMHINLTVLVLTLYKIIKFIE